MNIIIDRINQSIEVKKQITQTPELIDTIQKVAETMILAFKKGNKVLFCGNGGSAADAQHLAAELSGRFYFNRPPLSAEACHVNSSYLTAVANDFGYNSIFSRYIKAVGKKGDVVVGLSTSGNSENIVEAFKAAKNIEMKCIGFTGAKGGKMKTLSDFLINVPSEDTPRIQESHITIGHIICEMVEKTLFSNE